MAKINPVKVKQDAEKEERAGRADRAITLYRQLVEDNPRDWNTIKKIGDLYVRLTKNKEASVEYAKVADFYAKDGFLLQAIAVWKQINKLDPSTLEPYQHLAELYGKQDARRYFSNRLSFCAVHNDQMSGPIHEC